MTRGWWELNVQDFEMNDNDREYVGEMIKQGFTSGELVHEDDDSSVDWIREMNIVSTKEDARQLAIQFQAWVNYGALSLSELSHYTNALKAMGKKFGLLREFRENGLI